MMYPRLCLLKEFLSAEGTLFFHIDDNELSSSIALCDEIFGRKSRCFVVTFKQASATGHKSINPGCVNITNHILIYSKDRDAWKPNKVFTGRERDKRYSQFIINRSDGFSSWRFTTLAQAFATFLGMSVREARKIANEEPQRLDQFVLDNAASVIQPARPDYDAVGQETREAIDLSEANPEKIYRVTRDGYSDIYLRNGMRILFYSDKIKIIDGVPVSGEPLTTLWDDILSNNIHKEGDVEFPKGKKPEALIKRCLELAARRGDLVMDSFAGSGTTPAVAHKMGLRWIAVEMGDHATTHVAARLEKIIAGRDPNGITKEVNWKEGGGFRFCQLGSALFDEHGNVNEVVTFSDLAAHVFFCDTGSPIPKRAKDSSSLIGIFQGRAIYLLFTPASMGVPSAKAGNVLTAAVLKALPSPGSNFSGARVVYGEGCTVPDDRLAAAGVTFRQVPYQIEGI